MHGSGLTLLATPTTAKSERLKQAKAEAEKELAAFKAEREEQYNKRVAEVWGCRPRRWQTQPVHPQNSTNSEGNLKKLSQDADAQIASLQSSIASKKKEVLSFLVGHVTKVSK